MAKWQWNCYPMREKELLRDPFPKLFPDFSPFTPEMEKALWKYYFHSEECGLTSEEWIPESFFIEYGVA